jgi:putative NADH-flavin reductase
MVAAVTKLMGNQDLVLVARKCSVVTRFRSTIGLPGTLAVRLQPNHPADDPRGIAASIFDGLLYGCGDAVIGINPATDSLGAIETLLRLLDELISRLTGTPTRLGYLGGASSLLTEEGGPTVWEATKEHVPDDVKPEVVTGLDVLATLQASPESLDWFFVSPPADFGSWLGTPDKGAYVRGGDVLLKDADGNSTISAADLAIAVVDEIETPAHHRRRFTAIH